MKPDRWVEEWGLTDVRPLAETPTSWLWRVLRTDGRQAVLKVATDIGRVAEAGAAEALVHWGPTAAAEVYEVGDGAVLLEALTGDLMATPEDTVSLPVLFDVAARLNAARAPAGQNFQTLADRCARLNDLSGLPELALPLAQQAQDEAARLLRSSPPPVLLHGDLHHANVLQASRENGLVWVAFDPQPIVGDPSYCVSNLFGNPIPHREIMLAPRRVSRLAEAAAERLELPLERILGWGLVHQYLSALWAIEDGHDPSERLAVAAVIAEAGG